MIKEWLCQIWVKEVKVDSGLDKVGFLHHGPQTRLL